ncbi:hypothetical protein OG455_14435 [Kitasatospora sp. NBC_01287]|uniref:hypothetical protein n=1 Tax=Kitasatospora sp. NBC_01287 TaxID=2903573 RepID=UPI002254EA33|nr:hypothetical protein [Kitasatospora sp. NBC_01287]MCX4746702.1 hypothetical protein [Kitasatospora sp. NBC_01287]
MSGGDEQAEHRGAGPRHAAPRAGGRTRARLLAFAAVPTALLMGSSLVPDMTASAATNPSCAAAATAPVTITQVPKSQLTPVPAPKATKASATGGGQVVSAAFVAPNAGPAAQRQAAAAETSRVVQADDSGGGGGLIGDIINGIAGIFDPNHQNQQQPKPAATTPAATPSSAPAAAPRAGAPATPGAPSGSAPASGPTSGAPAPAQPGASSTPAPPAAATTPAAPAPGAGAPAASPSATPGASASASPSAGATPSGSTASGSTASGAPATAPAPSGTAAPSAVASALANGDTRPLCPVDTSKVAAAAVQGGQVVPDQNWTLNTSRLALHGAVFGGVYEVHTPTTTKRVLKFTVSSVDIDNLDMSTIEDTGYGSTAAQTFHVKGAPGSTSTMVDGPITMYVESLSGELSALYGIPIPPLGTLTLTPDTLPTWLYDLIGAVPIPLDITMTGVTAIQAGQFGGTLHIPGMHLYNDNTPYPNGH